MVCTQPPKASHPGRMLGAYWWLATQAAHPKDGKPLTKEVSERSPNSQHETQDPSPSIADPWGMDQETQAMHLSSKGLRELTHSLSADSWNIGRGKQGQVLPLVRGAVSARDILSLIHRNYKNGRKREVGESFANVLVCEVYWEIEWKTEGGREGKREGGRPKRCFLLKFMWKHGKDL